MMDFETPCGDVRIDIRALIVAGWTGRDADAVDRHIAELAELGVAPPSRVPLFYRVAASMLVQKPAISVLGNQTSGEVEPLLIKSNNKVWLGLASDHTDRQLESYSVAHAKQVCHKPVANRLWELSDIQNHIDSLELRSWIRQDGDWTLYQQGTLEGLLPLDHLLNASELPDNAALLCGTLPAIGGVRPASEFYMALTDPVIERKIESSYRVESLPIIA